jgi:hypothetical protein
VYAALLGLADVLALVCIGVLLPDRLERVSVRLAAVAIAVAAICIGVSIAHELRHDPVRIARLVDGWHVARW